MHQCCFPASGTDASLRARSIWGCGSGAIVIKRAPTWEIKRFVAFIPVSSATLEQVIKIATHSPNLCFFVNVHLLSGFQI
jgi:hypothetical protein